MGPRLVPLILHFAFTIAVPMYFFVYQFILLPQTRVSGEGNAFILFALLLFISLAAIVLALFVPGRLPNLQRKKEDKPEQRRQKIMSATVIQGAFLESIAIYGLIGIFLDFLPWMTYLLMGLSFFALLAFTPRVMAWAEEMR